jgi:hypothetical protein
MSDPTITSEEDSRRSLGLASLICAEAFQLHGVSDLEGTAAEATKATGNTTHTGNLVEVLEKAMVDLGYNREELQKIWLVFLAAHRAAVRAADRLPLPEGTIDAALLARRHVCPLQAEEPCALNPMAPAAE